MEHIKEQIEMISRTLDTQRAPSSKTAKYIKLNASAMDIHLINKPKNAEWAIVKTILKKVSDSCHENIFKGEAFFEEMSIEDVAEVIGEMKIRFSKEEVEKFTQYKFKSHADLLKSLEGLKGNYAQYNNEEENCRHIYGFIQGTIIAPEANKEKPTDDYEVTVTPEVMAKLLGFGKDYFIFMPCGEKEVDKLDGRSYRLFMELIYACHTKDFVTTQRVIPKLKSIIGARGVKKHEEYKHFNYSVLAPIIKKINESGWLQVSYTALSEDGVEVNGESGRGKKAHKIKFAIAKTQKFFDFEEKVRVERDRAKAEWDK